MLATGAAFATPHAVDARPVPVAESYAELLKPIPNAVERLKLADAQSGVVSANIIPVQDNLHHHHHHHHRHNRAWYRANGYIWSGGVWVLRPVHHHHHHHHHD